MAAAVSPRLALVLAPGESVGPFQLGMPLNAALAVVKANPNLLPVCDVVFDRDRPLHADVALRLPSHGISLRFEAHSQLLRCVHLYDLARVVLRAQRRPLRADEPPGERDEGEALRVKDVLDAFRSPALWRRDRKPDDARLYATLQYRGMAVTVHIPPDADAEVSQPAAEGKTKFPRRFRSGASAEVTDILLHADDSVDAAAAPLHGLPFDLRGASPGGLLARALAEHFEPVEAEVGMGLLFVSSRSWLRFGSSPQDALSLLRSPSKVFVKGSVELPSPPERGDYMLEFQQRGIALLYEGSQHKLLKVVLYANWPDTMDFARFARCNFRLLGKREQRALGRRASAGVDVVSTWEDVKTLGEFGPVLRRETLAAAGSGAFGPTDLYACDGVVFHTTETGRLISVTLLHPELRTG